MTGPDRRALLRIAVASALAGLGATRAFALVPPGEMFVPPERPMRFTRTLARALGGDHRLTVERSFAVRFEQAGGGFVVTGEQVAVSVDAPALLAELAGLERARIERGLFPLRLDAAGLIDDVVRDLPSVGLDRVLTATRAVLAKNPPAPGGMADAAQFMALFHSSAASFLSHLPVDLFAPTAPHRMEERTLDLPGDAAGTVRVEFVASADPATGVMQQARRDITTTIEGQRRLSREDWTLAPL